MAKAFFYFYKVILGPALHALGGSQTVCRYPLSCSEYAYQSIIYEGVFIGSWKALLRVLSCNPWTSPRQSLFIPSRAKK